MPVFKKHGIILLFEIVFNGKESTRKIFIMCLVSVYVELVAFNNFAVDLLLEVATLTFFRRKIKWFRVLLGAVVGSVVATVYPLCPTAVQVVFKILLAPIMALIFDGDLSTKRTRTKLGEGAKNNVKLKRGTVQYLKRLAVFCLFTYFVGGIDYGLSFAFGIDVSSYWQFGVCAISLLTLLISVRVFVLKLSKNARKICDSTIRLGEAQATLKSLCDSGNALTDTLSGLPVVILSSNAEKSLFVDENSIEGFIDVKTVAGESSMPIIRFDDVVVKGRKFCAYGALARCDFDGVDVILQNTMF